jgi:hypothetical protein
MSLEDITGNRYGKLLVIKYEGNNKWLCRCDCGVEKEISGSNIKYGKTTSCGCSRQLSNIDQAVNILLSRYTVKSDKRNLKLNISRDEFKRLITSSCEYCGQVPSTPVNYKGKTILMRNGIDRIDSSKDYVDGNCVPCCWNCNRAKGDLTVEQYKKWLKQSYVHQYHKVTSLTPGQLIDLLFTTDYKCWWAQEDLMKYKDSDPEKSAQAAVRAQEYNAKRTKLMRTIDSVLDFSEDTNTEKTYSDGTIDEADNYTYFKDKK